MWRSPARRIHNTHAPPKFLRRAHRLTRLALVVALLVAGAVPAGVLALGPDVLPVFTDVPANMYFSSAIPALVQSGIARGTTPTTFSPFAPTIRADTAVFLHRSLPRV